MLFVTHIAAALHIGALTGQPLAALISSLFMDLDHLLIIRRYGIKRFFAGAYFRQLIDSSVHPTADAPLAKPLHTILALVGLTALVWHLFPTVALTFGISYLVHLLLDAATHTGTPLFYPWKKKIHGPIRYNSVTEHAIAFVLLVSYIVLYL